MGRADHVAERVPREDQEESRIQYGQEAVEVADLRMASETEVQAGEGIHQPQWSMRGRLFAGQHGGHPLDDDRQVSRQQTADDAKGPGQAHTATQRQPGNADEEKRQHA
jgi:hypothetical protein